MEQILKAMRLKAELDQLRPISPEQEARIMQKFRLDWNYHSNHIEGNSLTYGETKTLLLYGITAQGKPLKDHLEITGHNEALNWVLDVVKGSRSLTETFIRELHQLLLKEPYEVDAITPDGKPTKRWIKIGEYKSVPNHVRTKTGEIHYFASVEETPAKMHDLMEWLRGKQADPEMNPILVAAEFHHRFISIHPFDDGNGRTGRLLMNFIFLQSGYPPVVIKTEDKQNYYHALQQADGGNIEAFIEYIAVNLVRSLEIMIAGAKGESIDEPDDLDKEIALLEQRLKGVGKKAEVLKSKEAILEVFDGSIVPLAKLILENFQKFDGFYAITSFEIYFPTTGKQKLTIIEQLVNVRDRLDRDTETMSLIYHFKSLKQLGLGDTEFRSNFTIEFGEISYRLMSNKALLHEKLYGVQITEAEIVEIVVKEGKRHLAFIEQKIKEFEEKAGK
jgi:Fic family protein